MSITFIKKPGYPKIGYVKSGGTETELYTGKGSTVGADIFAAAVTMLPAFLDGLVRNSIKVDATANVNYWDVEIGYGPVGQDGTADPVGSTPTDPRTNAPTQPGTDSTASTDPLPGGYSFDIGADTLHITQSRRNLGNVAAGAELFGGVSMSLGSLANTVNPSTTVSTTDKGYVVWILSGPTGWRRGGYKITGVNTGLNEWTLDRVPAKTGSAGGAVWQILPQGTDYGGAIGVGEDKIEGVDIYQAKTEWTRTVPILNMSMANWVNLEALAWHKNDAPFYGRAAGEVLFMGASGTYSDSQRWGVTLKFAVRKNEANVAIIPGVLTIPYKRGWDYLWVRYKKFEVFNSDDDLWLIEERPVYAYVEEVYPDADFSQIGIGT